MSEVSGADVNLFSSQLLEPEHRPVSIIEHSAGMLLARARQDKDWSIQQVADQLKLSTKQIVALEGDKFEELPKMVIVRGFVRTYAKLLKIDADPLIALLPKSLEDTQLQAALKPALSTPFLESRLSLMGRQDSNKKYLLGAALLAIFAVVFFIIQKTDVVDSIKDFVGQNPLSANEVRSASNLVLPIISEVPASKLDSGESLPMDSSTSSVRPFVISDGQQQNQKIPESDQIASSASSNVEDKRVSESFLSVNSAASPSDKDVLKLKFRQDSWIQIKKENGVILTSHLAKAGTEETFSVNETLQVRIGNAVGVDGILRGAPLEILADKGSNVVNLNVK